MSIYGQMITLLTCYRVVYHICQFGTGRRTQKARPVEVLTHSQGNLEAKWNLEQPIQDK